MVDAAATPAAAATLSQLVIRAVDAPVLGTTTDVITGSKVYGVYIKAICASNDPIDIGVIPRVYLMIWKNPGDNLTAPTITSVGSSDNKRFVLHQEMTMIENKGQGSNPKTLFDGVVKIPKGFNRFGPNDALRIVVQSVGLDIAFCFQAHFKEFR